MLCQWFPPEHAPIGNLLKELAIDLTSKGHYVTIITGFPNHPAGILYDGYKKSLFSLDMIDGVRIVRCYLYTSPKRTIGRRLLNHISFAASSFLAACRLEKHDLLFIVTPPLSNAMTGYLLKNMLGMKSILNVQDIYPDAAVSAGVIGNRVIINILKRLEKWIYGSVDRITVISAGFLDNLMGKGVPCSKVCVIPNWLDLEEIIPLPRDNDYASTCGLQGRFIVLYSGTIGLISGAELLLDCAIYLEFKKDIIFVFVGEGVTKEIMVKEAQRRKLQNVRFLPFQPREKLSGVLSSSDVTVVTLKKGQGKFSVPSKVLGYMAAARPVVASVDPDSDTKKLVYDSKCGICVDPGDVGGMSAAILELYQDRRKAEILGRNGRDYLLRNFERKEMAARYEALFKSCLKA